MFTVSRYSITAVLSFLWCFLLQCSEAEPGVAHPPLPAAGKAAAASELRQSVVLDGAYAGEVLIEGNNWEAASGGQEVALLFSGRKLNDIRQVELILELIPASAFDLESAAFAPEDPFVTFGKGVEPLDNGRLRLAGAIFSETSETIEGDHQFGTFTVRTSDGFNSQTETRIEVNFLSLGPSSTDREEYQHEDLGLGVVVSAGDVVTDADGSTWGRIKAMLAR
jgi:hypothetical protein